MAADEKHWQKTCCNCLRVDMQDVQRWPATEYGTHLYSKLVVVVLKDSLFAMSSWLTDFQFECLFVEEDMVFFQDVQAEGGIEVAVAVGRVRFVLGIRLMLAGGSHWELVQSNPAAAAVVQVVVCPFLTIAMTSRTWSVSDLLAKVSVRSLSDFDQVVELHRILKKTRQHCVDLDWLGCTLEPVHCRVHSESYNPPSGLMAHMREQ
jgi:hypothetical protein